VDIDRDFVVEGERGRRGKGGKEKRGEYREGRKRVRGRRHTTTSKRYFVLVNWCFRHILFFISLIRPLPFLTLSVPSFLSLPCWIVVCAGMLVDYCFVFSTMLYRQIDEIYVNFMLESHEERIEANVLKSFFL
jgi:hypothetical protein